MNTCKDCKHWTTRGSWQEAPPICLLMEQPKAPDRAALDDEYGCGIYVGPDFGCIHWAAKVPR